MAPRTAMELADPARQKENIAVPKTRVLIAAALLAVAASSSVFAAQATGTIESISKARDTFSLANGKTFHLPEGIEVQSLKVGEHVKVSYVVGKNKLRQVSAVTRIR
jgi:hypothetical protein